jgi:hypothetical protein
MGYGGNAGYSFNGDEDTGMYRGGSDLLAFNTAGRIRLMINATGELFPLHGVFAPVDYGTSKGYSFNGDTDTGMYRPTSNQLSFHSGGVERMRIDSSGKVGIGTSTPTAGLEIKGTQNVLSGGLISAGLTSGYHMAIDVNDIQAFENNGDYGSLYLNDYGGSVDIGHFSSTTTIQGTFRNSSDRNLKEDFSPVDGQAVLDRLFHLPISTWKFKDNEGRRHIGPVAQDFHDAFDGLLDLHSDDKTIAPLDEAGIAFVSIQELARQHQVKDAEIKKLQEENASLRASFAAQERQISAQNARDNSLEAKLAAIEKTLSALNPGKRTASLSKSRAAE